MQNRIKCMIATVAIMGVWAGSSATGMAVDPVTAASALPAVPSAVKIVKDVAAVPVAVAELLRLPLGVSEMVLAPLPGISFTSGLANTGQGLLAPFQLVGAVLKLPYNLAAGVTELSQKVVLAR